MSMKIVVVDLDGTLLSVNTFHKWLIFLFKKSISTNPLDSLKILSIISLRLAKVITHKQMKYQILKISESLKYMQHINQFVDELDKYLNKEVSLHLNQQNITILATAAPELYAKTIADKYGFEYLIATPSTSEKKWYENIREKKKEKLEELLDSIKVGEVHSVLSDHYDDIPIMKIANHVFLVNASLKTKEMMKKHRMNYSIISNID